jgi:hypothetical protein
LKTVYDKAKLKVPSIAGKPTTVYHTADSAEGDFVFDRAPDKLYVVEIMYYADILKIDLTSTLYSRISAPPEWALHSGRVRVGAARRRSVRHRVQEVRNETFPHCG